MCSEACRWHIQLCCRCALTRCWCSQSCRGHLQGWSRHSQACRRRSQALPGAPKDISGAPRCSRTYYNLSDSIPAPRLDLAGWFRRYWRIYHLSTSLESQQSSLSCSATPWIQALWMALMRCGMTLKVIVSIWYLAFAALAVLTDQVKCSCSVRCMSIQLCCQGVASLLKCLEPSLSV